MTMWSPFAFCKSSFQVVHYNFSSWSIFLFSNSAIILRGSATQSVDLLNDDFSKSLFSFKSEFEIKKFFDHHTLYLAWQLTIKEVKDVMQPLCLSKKILHVRSFCNCYYCRNFLYSSRNSDLSLFIYSVQICICVASFISYWIGWD